MNKIFIILVFLILAAPSLAHAQATTLYPAVSMYGANAGTITYNFGAATFAYTVPSGYQAGVCY